MKKSTKILLTLAVMLLSATLPASLLAQDISQAKKMYYYERWKSARTGFEQAAGSNPEAAYWLVETLLQTGDVAEAKTAAQSGLNAFAGNPLLVVAMGHVELFEGKSADAKNHFEGAINMTDKKNKVAILTAIGRAHGNVALRNSFPDYGIEKLKQALQIEPRNGTIYMVMGDNYRKKLDGGGAVEAYTNAMSNDGSLTAQANYKIGKVYATQQNCEVFSRYFNQAIAADANFMPAYRELFENYADRESKCVNFDMAKTYFDKYVSTSDQGDDVELLRTNYAYGSKDYNTAIQKGQALMTSMGAKAPAKLNKLIAYSYFELKDYANTIKWLEKYFAEEKVADNIVTHNYRVLAQAYDAAGQLAKSRDTWMKAGDFEPDETKKSFYYVQAADVAMRMGDKAGSISIVRTIFDKKQNPTKADYVKLGSTYYEAGLYDSTIALYTVYGQKWPDDWRSPLWIARSNAQIDSNLVTGIAAPYYEKVLAMTENDTTINSIKVQANMYLFAYTINVKKDQKGAEVYLDRVLAIDPENPTAKDYKAKLNKAPNTPPRTGTGTKPPATPATGTGKPPTPPATPQKPPQKTASVQKPATKTATVKTTTKTTSKPVVKNK